MAIVGIADLFFRVISPARPYLPGIRYRV
jgi:hypothetical protein